MRKLCHTINKYLLFDVVYASRCSALCWPLHSFHWKWLEKKPQFFVWIHRYTIYDAVYVDDFISSHYVEMAIVAQRPFILNFILIIIIIYSLNLTKLKYILNISVLCTRTFSSQKYQ